MVESSPSNWYVPGSVSMATSPSGSMAIVVGMMNDRSGLWTVTSERVSLLRDSLHRLSGRSKVFAQEMISSAERGERLWQTKAEYYAVIAEIRADAGKVSKSAIDEAVAHIVRGSRVDGVDDRPWVKQALEILTRISREK